MCRLKHPNPESRLSETQLYSRLGRVSRGATDSSRLIQNFPVNFEYVLSYRKDRTSIFAITSTKVTKRTISIASSDNLPRQRRSASVQDVLHVRCMQHVR
jgi:hypothetical protein